MTAKEKRENAMFVPVIGDEVGSAPVHDIVHAELDDPSRLLRAAGAIVLSAAVGTVMVVKAALTSEKKR